MGILGNEVGRLSWVSMFAHLTLFHVLRNGHHSSQSRANTPRSSGSHSSNFLHLHLLITRYFSEPREEASSRSFVLSWIFVSFETRPWHDMCMVNVCKGCRCAFVIVSAMAYAALSVPSTSRTGLGLVFGTCFDANTVSRSCCRKK